MPSYFASYVPIMQAKKTVVFVREGYEEARKMELGGALELIQLLHAGDELFLMMGSTNAAVALGAVRRGVSVHQISYARAITFLAGEEGVEEESGKKRIKSEHVLQIASGKPGLFYSAFRHQLEVLEITSAWEALSRAMKARMNYANEVRSHLQRQAVISGLSIDVKELDAQIEAQVGRPDPQDPFMQAFLSREKQRGNELDSVMRHSELYKAVFGPIRGIGPRIAARIIAEVGNIDRFKTAQDLSRYGGFEPTREGKLPSKKRGGVVNRSPLMNAVGFLAQDQMWTYGAKTELGIMLRDHVNRECPCTPEERKNDPELRKKWLGAVKRARINMTRELLRQVWENWRRHVGLPVEPPAPVAT